MLRSTVAPGTTEFVAGYLEKHRGFKVGEDFFVAHVPERIAADRFLEEIGTLPCIVGGVGEASGERAARLFEVLGAPIVQTTPVQAELAKIWTNILRYATFALPEPADDGLRALRRERVRRHRPDQPRLPARRHGAARVSPAGTCLRKDFAFSEEKSNAPGMLLGVSRVHESVPLFLVDGIKRRLGDLRERKVAVLGLAFKRDTDDERDSLSHKLIRLLERELADVAVHDPVVATPTSSFEDAVAAADAVVRRHQPQRVLDRRRAAGDRRARRRRLPRGRPLERARHGAGLRLHERDRRAAHVSRVLVTGGAGMIGAAVVRRLLGDPDFEVRVSDQRPAPLWMREGCEVHTRRPARPRAGPRGDRRLLARDPPRRDRRRHRELPQAAVHAHRGQPRALQRRLPRGAGRRRRAVHVRVVEHGVRARRAVPDDRGLPARLPAAALGVRLVEARGRGLLPRRARRARPAVHDLPPVQRLRARASSRTPSRASPTSCRT